MFCYCYISLLFGEICVGLYTFWLYCITNDAQVYGDCTCANISVYHVHPVVHACSVVRGRTAVGPGVIRAERAQGVDRALVQQLRERCEEQSMQLQSLQGQLKKAFLCLDVFAITTQHLDQKVGHSRAPHTWRYLHVRFEHLRKALDINFSRCGFALVLH